jgi:hypothetical protein
MQPSHPPVGDVNGHVASLRQKIITYREDAKTRPRRT